MTKSSYSIIIPLYNEQESLDPLWQEIKQVMTKFGGNWDLIFVNDGSTDGSEKVIKNIAKSNSNARAINLGYNQGKSAALMAGFAAAQGEIVITMDGDLQDNPIEIPRLVKELNSGYDLVSGYKKERHDPIHKTFPSRIFNALIRLVTGTKLHDINCGFKVYRRSVIEDLYLYGELYRFIPVIAASYGARISELAVDHRARKFGKSKFGVSRFMRGLFDLLTVIFRIKFLKRPLHFFGTIGGTFLAIGLIACIYLSYIHFVHHASIGDRPLLLLGVLLIISGIQLICTGLLADIITFYHQRQELRLISEKAKRRLSKDA